MDAIVLIPGLIALAVAWSRGAQSAFLNVYLPVLFFLPEYYRWTVPGIPKVTFSHSAIIAVVGALFLLDRTKWKFSWSDWIVAGFVISVSTSEYVNANYKEAQNLTFDMIAWFLLPYVAAKAIVEPMAAREEFARRIVLSAVAVAVISVYEFRFGMTPYRLMLDPFFPGQGTGWVTTFRWGFVRIAGPYGHAILAGVTLVVAYRLHKWLEWNRSATNRSQAHVNSQRWKGQAVSLALIAGIIMTMVRGPWIGGILAALVSLVGNSRNPRRVMALVLLLSVLAGIPAGFALHSYASVGRAAAKTVAQESAAYRKELIDQYLDIAIERSMLGWGRNTWPKVAGMPSIDNYYLLLALMHGFIAVGLFAVLLLGIIVRLFRIAFSESLSMISSGPSLAFTLAGILVAISFSVGTVFLGGQLVPLTALMAGWSEGYIIRDCRLSEANPLPASIKMPFTFGRVIA